MSSSSVLTYIFTGRGDRRTALWWHNKKQRYILASSWCYMKLIKHVTLSRMTYHLIVTKTIQAAINENLPRTQLKDDVKSIIFRVVSSDCHFCRYSRLGITWLKSKDQQKSAKTWSPFRRAPLWPRVYIYRQKIDRNLSSNSNQIYRQILRRFHRHKNVTVIWNIGQINRKTFKKMNTLSAMSIHNSYAHCKTLKHLKSLFLCILTRKMWNFCCFHFVKY